MISASYFVDDVQNNVFFFHFFAIKILEIFNKRLVEFTMKKKYTFQKIPSK
jgi:hypothetical protein